MLRVTGGSSSSTSPRATATGTTTTPRPPDWRPVCSLTAPADCWPPATSPSVPRSTSTTGCSPWTPVIPTEGSSSTPTSSPVPAPVTSLPNPSLCLVDIRPRQSHPYPSPFLALIILNPHLSTKFR